MRGEDLSVYRAAIGRYKPVIGGGLRFRKDGLRTAKPRRRSGLEPDAGVGTPDLRPHRMTSDRARDAATRSFIHATRIFLLRNDIRQTLQ
jgi:hypothetical protein